MAALNAKLKELETFQKTHKALYEAAIEKNRAKLKDQRERQAAMIAAIKKEKKESKNKVRADMTL